MSEIAPGGAVRLSPKLAVDPKILATIKSPTVPWGVPAPVVPPSSLPGAIGIAESVRSIYGTWRHGVVHEQRMQARYGEVYRSMFMRQPFVAVSAPDEVNKILRNEQGIWSSAMAWEYLFFDGLNVEGGNAGSLLTLDFEAHSASRRIAQPAFSSSAMKGYIEIARPLFERSIERWIADRAVDLKPAMHAIFPGISNQILTGIEDPAQLARFDKALRDTSSGGQSLVRTRQLNPLLPTARRAYGYLTDYFVALAPKRRAQPGTDLFSQLCLAASGPNGLSDKAMVRSFLTMMLGAHDSTSLGMISMGYLLAKHPEWQERLRDEVDRVGDQALEWKGLQKLEQLEWVWKESIRLWPVTDFIPRRALRDVEIRGHQLKAGTLVGAMVACVNRHPAWWTRPLTFDPERFSPERAEHKKHPAIFSPFGGGPHLCIGMQLGTLEAKVFFHSLLRRCRFELQKDYEAKHSYRPLGCVSGRVGLKLVAR